MRIFRHSFMEWITIFLFTGIIGVLLWYYDPKNILLMLGLTFGVFAWNGVDRAVILLLIIGGIITGALLYMDESFEMKMIWFSIVAAESFLYIYYSLCNLSVLIVL